MPDASSGSTVGGADATIVRGDERIQVNLKKILKGKDADVELKPGDRVVVPVSPI